MEQIGEILQGTPIVSATLSSERTRVCPICKRKIQPVKVELFGQERYMPVKCKCEIEQYEREEKQREILERKRRIEELFGFSQLGPRYQKATFENWEQRPGTQIAFREATNFVKNAEWEKGQGIVFYGPHSTGKTHLAAAIINAVIPKLVPAIFYDAPELLGKFRSTYGELAKYNESTLLSAIGEADVIVLDDLGAEYLTEWAAEKIYEIVNTVYRHEKSLIVTTNLDVASGELEERIGPRIFERIIEMCRLVEVKGWSYRRVLAERKMQREGSEP